MLMNLLDNALKFTPSGGSVLVTLEGGPEEYAIRVHDTGRGISTEDQPYVFDRFFRTDRSRTPSDSEGAGLGLSIARSIAELHNGHLKLEQSGAGGSMFIVLLPRRS